MKLILRLFFILIISTKLFAQTPIAANKMVYLDSTWAETTSENYKYIRLVEEYYSSNKKLYTFKDYYKSKVLKMVGTSTDRDILKPEGQFVYYYENGNKQSTVTYADNKKTGKEYNWYENTNLKSELEYYENKKGDVAFKVQNYWNAQKEHTVTDGNGTIEDITQYQQRSGQIKDGLPQGVWKGKNTAAKYSYTENYENGKLLSGTSVDSLNTERSYKVVFQKPVPKNGINSFYKYVARNMNIPVEARNKVTGKIYMTFIVDKEGNLVEPKILKGIGYGLDESAIAVITGGERWNPGLVRGIPTRVSYSLPITITKKDQ